MSTVSLRERLGGRWAFSWQASIAGSVLITMLIVARGTSLGGTDSTLAVAIGWFVVALIAVAMKSGYQLIGEKTILRNRRIRPEPIWKVILFDLSVGFVFGGTLVFVALLLDPSLQQVTWTVVILRVISFMIVTLFWYVFTTLLLDARQRFDDEREALLEELVAAELVEVQEQRVVESLQAQVTAELDDAIGRAKIATATALISGSDDPHALSAQLRTLASGSVRSLSHELMDDSKDLADASAGRPVISSMAHEVRFWVGPVLLLIAFAYAVDVTIRGETQVGAVATVVFGVICALIMTLSNVVMDRLTRVRLAIYIATIVLLEAVAVLYVAQVSVRDALTGTWSLSLPPLDETAALMILVAVGLLGSSYAAALFTYRQRVLDRLRLDVDGARARQRAMAQRTADASRRVGSHLHGSLQTRLMVCAGELDRAAEAGDQEAVSEALNRAWAILNSPIMSEEEQGSALDVITSYVDRWSGLMEITLDLGTGLERLPESSVLAIGVVLEEGLANAYRHGDASEVSIRISPQGATTVVTLIDNGAFSGAGQPGLGSRRMAGVGAVSLEQVPAGTCLTVVIATGNPVDAGG